MASSPSTYRRRPNKSKGSFCSSARCDDEESDVDFWRQQARTCSQHITRTSALMPSACVRLCPILRSCVQIGYLSIRFPFCAERREDCRWRASLSKFEERGNGRFVQSITPTTITKRCTVQQEPTCTQKQARSKQASTLAPAIAIISASIDDIDEANSLPTPPYDTYHTNELGAPFDSNNTRYHIGA